MTSPAGPDRLLWLLRHAKTLTQPPRGGSDYERVLAPRGKRDADALALRLGTGGDRFGFAAKDLPGLVLCSSAARTAQTAERVLAGLKRRRPTLELERALYGAGPEEVVARLRLVDPDVRSVMVVGHNPTASTLAVTLPSAADAAGRQLVEERGFPTCALAVYRVPPSSWAELGEGSATLLGLFTPPF